MGPFPSGYLFFPSTNTTVKRLGIAAAVFLAGSLGWSGCGAYPTTQGAMFRSELAQNSKNSISNATAAAPPRWMSTTSAALSEPEIPSSAPTSTRGPDADASKVRGNLGVDQNSLNRLRGRFGPLVPNSFACSPSSMSGAGQINCTVSLNGSSATSVLVALTSSNASVSVPASVTVAKNASSATFIANIAAVTSSVAVTITAASNGGTALAHLQLNAATAPTLASLSCSASSITGAGSDACTVTLAAAAPAGGVTVSLSSNNSAVTTPATVNVPANATSGGFTATVASVSSNQTATLTAAAGASATFALRLIPASQPALSVNATSISFGIVTVNEPATQSLTLSSTGTAAVTVNSVKITGTGFSASGVKFPITLSPGQSATLNIQFNPTVAGAISGQLTISSNSSTGATTALSLTGTGQSFNVQLSWNAPSGSTNPISGYRVYRAAAGSSAYQLLNATLDKLTNYLDSTVSDDASYQYYVTTIDSAGAESVPSNTASVSVP